MIAVRTLLALLLVWSASLFSNPALRLARAEPPATETWNGSVEYRNQWGKTIGSFDATASVDGTVAGIGSGVWMSVGSEEQATIDVTGRRDGDVLNLTIHVYGKGDDFRVDFTAPIVGNEANGTVNGDAPAGTFPQAYVHLECRNCNVGG
jgi:hypothetical protein